jgi:hypothetical protein
VKTVPRIFPITLSDLPDVADHAIAGKATVPAVELLDLLVKTATANSPRADAASSPMCITEASFPRFLPAAELPHCAFEVTLDDGTAGTRAILTSRIALPRGIHRTRTHAVATVGGHIPEKPPLPAITYNFELPADRAYEALIPFGPRFRNLRGTLRFGRDGATGVVCSPDPAHLNSSLAGCPYLFDSAMHLACLWGQRYAGYVAYPTGFAARTIPFPTARGERRCIVVPRSVEPRRLSCDLWLTDGADRICDVIVGLAMAPLATGVSPPAWVALGESPWQMP